MQRRAYAGIVLAAGRSTRMGGKRSKLLHHVAGIPVIGRVARMLQGLALQQNIFVVSYQKDEVMAAVRAQLPDAVAVDQGKPRGTGHAVQTAVSALSPDITDVIVVSGDAPLVRTQTLQELIEIHEKTAALASFVTFDARDPAGYGRVVRNVSGAVHAIVEQRECTPQQAAIRECNAGIYAFSAGWLKEEIHRLSSNNSKGEFYLTDLIMLAQDKAPVSTWKAPEDEVMGVNTPLELAQARMLANAAILRRHMENGVVFCFPQRVEVHEDVRLAPGVVVEADVSLRGTTRVGAQTHIGQGAILENADIEEDACILPYSLVENSRIRKGARIGPFARIRPDSDVGENAHVGNFVELKKTILHQGVKANHLSYLGDADVGAESNIGAGTITCNYDGKNKFQTHIGARVFVGSDTQLIAPVTVGDDAYIGTGTTVFSDVPAHALAINPRRQENRLGWVPPYARNAKKADCEPPK